MSKVLPQRIDNLLERMLSDELIIVNTNINELLAPSSVGETIWNRIDGKTTVDEIVALVCSDYGVEPDDLTEEEELPEVIGEVMSAGGETAGEQIRGFIEILAEKGLVKLNTVA